MHALELLSLDFTRCVFGELGVGVSWEESLRGLARDALLGRLGTVGRAFDIESGNQPYETYLAWIAPFLSVLERAMGLDSRRNLEYWVKHVMCASERSPWHIYEEMFTSWAAHFRKTAKDSIGLEADPQVIVLELDRLLDIASVDDRLKKQAASFLSDWDIVRFRRLGVLEIPEGSDFFPFSDDLSLSVERHRFQVFWRWLTEHVSKTDIEAIGRAALGQKSPPQAPRVSPAELPLPPVTAAALGPRLLMA